MNLGKNTKSKNNEIKLEHHVFKFETKAITSTDENFYYVEGYATKWNGIDSYNDRIVKGAYTNTILKNKEGIPAFFMHNSYDMPVGLWFEFKEDMVGLFVKCRLPKGDEFVERIILQMKAGSIDALSIGYRVVKYSEIMENGVMIRVLEEVDLKEISLINKGYQADSGALITDFKNDASLSLDSTIVNAMVEAKRKGTSPETMIQIKDYYHEKGKIDPFEGDAVLSVEELKNMSKSNLVYAIRKLNLSAKASQHLAELLSVPKSNSKGSESVDEEPKDSIEAPIEVVKNESKEAISNALEDLIKTLKQNK